MNSHRLTQQGYINVTGLSCKSFGLEDMKFFVPELQDYPSRRHISGKDFIFLLLDNGQTWYKKIDLSTTTRASLRYEDGINIVCMDGHNPENTRGTAFAYPFEFDEAELEMRRCNHDSCVKKPADVTSSAEIATKILLATSEMVQVFLKFLMEKTDSELKQFPNDEYLKAFGSKIVQDVPVADDQVRSLYMLVVISAQREGHFPFYLKYPQFVTLVKKLQPPMRYKGAE